MANPRHVFRAEGNAWLQQLEDQIVLGPSHVFEYIKTDGYKRLVDEERFTSFFTIFMSIKQSILHDYDVPTVEGTHDYVDVLHYGGVFTHSKTLGLRSVACECFFFFIVLAMAHHSPF